MVCVYVCEHMCVEVSMPGDLKRTSDSLELVLQGFVRSPPPPPQLALWMLGSKLCLS